MKAPLIGLSMNYMKLGSYHQYHIRDTYLHAIHDNGGVPFLLPCLPDRAVIDRYLDSISSLIIIGGMDYPPHLYGEQPHPTADIMEKRRSDFDLMLFEAALQRQLPLLGICAGMQLMNIATGGKLIQHLDNVDTHFGEAYHHISFPHSKHLTAIFPHAEQVVNSNHHQGINPDFVGKGFTPVAFADDGQIEAIEYDCDHFVLGIQWHPERVTSLAPNARPFTKDEIVKHELNQHRDTFFQYFIRLAAQ